MIKNWLLLICLALPFSTMAVNDSDEYAQEYFDQAKQARYRRATKDLLAYIGYDMGLYLAFLTRCKQEAIANKTFYAKHGALSVVRAAVISGGGAVAKELHNRYLPEEDAQILERPLEKAGQIGGSIVGNSITYLLSTNKDATVKSHIRAIYDYVRADRKRRERYETKQENLKLLDNPTLYEHTNFAVIAAGAAFEGGVEGISQGIRDKSITSAVYASVCASTLHTATGIGSTHMKKYVIHWSRNLGNRVGYEGVGAVVGAVATDSVIEVFDDQVCKSKKQYDNLSTLISKLGWNFLSDICLHVGLYALNKGLNRVVGQDDLEESLKKKPHVILYKDGRAVHKNM